MSFDPKKWLSDSFSLWRSSIARSQAAQRDEAAALLRKRVDALTDSQRHDLLSVSLDSLPVSSRVDRREDEVLETPRQRLARELHNAHVGGVGVAEDANRVDAELADVEPREAFARQTADMWR